MNLDVKEQSAGRRQTGAVPRVSVIIPSYNHERFVARALDSVLTQTYKDFEIVITDDASTDGSADVLRVYADHDSRIKLFVNRFNYETHSVNNCIQHARGDYIAVLHSDDEFFPTKLEKQLAFLDRHPEVAAVFSQVRIVDEQGRDFPDRTNLYCTVFNQPNRSRHEWLRHFFLKGNCLCHPSVLIRRSVYDTLGVYNPLMGAVDDLDMWVRVCLHHEIHLLPDTLVNFRLLDRDANVSGDKPETFRRWQYELVKILDHFESPRALAQLHCIFPEVADQVRLESDAVKRRVLAMMALKTGHLSHRFWGIDLLYRLLSNPETKRQLTHQIGSAPDADFIRMNGTLNPFTVEHRPAVHVFWPVAGAYSEVNSRSVYCPQSQWSEVRIPVPAWDTATPLRFDPCDFACVIKISEIKIVSRTDGRCVWSCGPKEPGQVLTLSGTALWLSDAENLSILSTGNDPQIYLSGIPPLPDLPLELRVWIKVDTDLYSAAREIETLRSVASARHAECQKLETQVEALNAAAVECDAQLQTLQGQLQTLRDASEEAKRLATQTETLQALAAERISRSKAFPHSWRRSRPWLPSAI